MLISIALGLVLIQAPASAVTHELIQFEQALGSAWKNVVTGRTTATTKGPSPQTVTLRFSDFFVRRNGPWLVVASHATRIGS